MWQQNDITVTGMGVPHGNVPTIGYRVEAGGISIAFASDQNGSNPDFVDYIQGVDALVVHMAANENASGIMAELHATPSAWGQIAASADVGQVIVSHISTSDPAQLRTNLSVLGEHYTGSIVASEDLLCVDLG